jgi:hypothetical protein
MKKNTIITIIVVLLVVIVAFIALSKPQGDITETEAKCIGENSLLYVQLGCHACKIQEEMFGDNYQYLTKIDCFVESEKCSGISGTPTWEINGQEYVGVQSIEKLKELTGC